MSGAWTIGGLLVVVVGVVAVTGVVAVAWFKIWMQRLVVEIGDLRRVVSSLASEQVGRGASTMPIRRLSKAQQSGGRFCPSCFVGFHVDGNGNLKTPLVPLELGECPDCRRVRERRVELAGLRESLDPEGWSPQGPSSVPRPAMSRESPSPSVACPCHQESGNTCSRRGRDDLRPQC